MIELEVDDATKTVATDLKTRIIEQIIFMKKTDIDYARYALAQYNAALPWMRLNDGVREALKAQK